MRIICSAGRLKGGGNYELYKRGKAFHLAYANVLDEIPNSRSEDKVSLALVERLNAYIVSRNAYGGMETDTFDGILTDMGIPI